METQDYIRPRCRTSRTGIFFALSAIIGGALILAFNTGALFAIYKPVIISWPMLIFVIGFCSLIFHRRFSFTALFIMVAAIFFLMNRMGANSIPLFGWQIPTDFARTYWPVLLIAAGVLGLIARIVRPRRTWRNSYWERREEYLKGCTHNNFKDGDVSAIFGSGKHTILDPAFEGGRVSAVFGEVTLDLRRAGLPEGKTTILEVNIVFGNAIIILPESWNVELKSTPIMGTFTDKREKTGTPPDLTRTIEIRVYSVFSGGELRN